MPRVDDRNTSSYWSDRGLAGLSLLQADFTTHEYAPHRHDELVIAVTRKGGAIIRSGGAIVEARPTVLFISNPAELQAAWMGRSQRWQYCAFYLSDSAVAQVTRNLGLVREPRFVQSALRDPQLCEAFLLLHRTLAQGRDRFKQLELITAALGSLFARHAVRQERAEVVPVDRRHLNKVLELMNQCFQDNLELADLAEVAGLTIFQLIRLFRRVTGLTPHAHLVQLRLNSARRQLQRGASLAEAATANGFYDQSALTKDFKRAYGITPGQFAAAVRPGPNTAGVS